jgi:hypothetical protein
LTFFAFNAGLGAIFFFNASFLARFACFAASFAFCSFSAFALAAFSIAAFFFAFAAFSFATRSSLSRRFEACSAANFSSRARRSS